MNRHIAKQWDNFQALTIPGDAPEIQKREMRRAFYAGVASVLGLMMSSFEEGVEPTEADLKIMDDIDAELKEWATLLEQGKA